MAINGSCSDTGTIFSNTYNYNFAQRKSTERTSGKFVELSIRLHIEYYIVTAGNI